MQSLLLATCLAGICMSAGAAETRMMSITERNGVSYVSAMELERNAGIAVKKLPGGDEVVVCSENRCARVKGFLREGDVTLVNVAELAKVLGFEARFSEDRRQVHFEFQSKSFPSRLFNHGRR